MELAFRDDLQRAERAAVEDAHRHLGARDVLLDQDVTAGARGEPHRAPEVGATTDDGDADARALAIRLDDDGER